MWNNKDRAGVYFLFVVWLILMFLFLSQIGKTANIFDIHFKTMEEILNGSP